MHSGFFAQCSSVIDPVVHSTHSDQISVYGYEAITFLYIFTREDNPYNKENIHRQLYDPKPTSSLSL